MFIGLAAVAACIAVTAVAAAPARTRPAVSATPTVRRSLPFPSGVTAAEVEWMLGLGLPDHLAPATCRLAAARDLSPALLWEWAETHGPMKLALALSAGYDGRDLALTTAAGTDVDTESLELLAELHGDLMGSTLAQVSRSSERRAA